MVQGTEVDRLLTPGASPVTDGRFTYWIPPPPPPGAPAGTDSKSIAVLPLWRPNMLPAESFLIFVLSLNTFQGLVVRSELSERVVQRVPQLLQKYSTLISDIPVSMSVPVVGSITGQAVSSCHLHWCLRLLRFSACCLQFLGFTQPFCASCPAFLTHEFPRCKRVAQH